MVFSLFCVGLFPFFLVEEFYGTRYQSGFFSLINVVVKVFPFLLVGRR